MDVRYQGHPGLNVLGIGHPLAQVGYMQLHNIISSPSSAVYRQLTTFRSNIEKRKVWRPKDDIQFVFLCGANIDVDIPSKRREFLLDFSSKKLPHAKFFLAESMFKVLKAEGNKANLLDIENELSSLADFVIVILESESAFCELGAFATHKELRKKMIVINDSEHRNSESFINLGPVKAIDEISHGKHVIYYKMEEDGKWRGDGIGDVYKNIYDIIHKEPLKRRTRIKDLNPNISFTKESSRFIHDLIYFSSPISNAELSRVIKILFEKSNDKNLQKHIGLLCATEQIERKVNKEGVGLYSSMYSEPFFEYGVHDIHNIISSFKNMYFRYDRHRIK